MSFVKNVDALFVKKWQSVINTVDFQPIVRTMLREHWVRSEDRARTLIEAFVQWFLIVNHSEHEKPYVMFEGPVDRAFHAFVLNTEFYADFCNTHAGKFINHNPLDNDLASEVEQRGGISYTIDILVDAYGNNLHPELRRWVRQAQKGKLTASSVSCVGCDYNIEAQSAHH